MLSGTPGLTGQHRAPTVTTKPALGWCQKAEENQPHQNRWPGYVNVPYLSLPCVTWGHRAAVRISEIARVEPSRAIIGPLKCPININREPLQA